MRRSPFDTGWAVLVVSLVMLTAVVANCHAVHDPTLIADIERMAELGENAPQSTMESLVDRIEENRSFVRKSLLPRLKSPNASEKQLLAYLWALGLAGDQQSVEPIIQVAGQSESELVKASCLRTLSMIGGEISGEFLLLQLDKTTDGEMRYFVLNLLCQMQYEPALPRTEEILRKDPKQYYWQPIFVFGKMGDKSVPFLLEKISDEDRNVRWNAIHVLGQWLIPVEAAQPFRDHYWREGDSRIRGLILSGLLNVTPSLEAIEKFSQEVINREQDESLVNFARETVTNMEELKQAVGSFEKKREPSAEKFEQEYERLFKSRGNEGDYDILSAASSHNDILRLKKLRERILQRDSDESFYDHQDVNRIIMLDRLSVSAK